MQLEPGILDTALSVMPLWALGIAIVLACLTMRALGTAIFHWRQRRVPEGSLKATSEAEGYIVPAILGLLAFVLGLTYSLALDRYDTRRVLVGEEANAIGTAYLRASLLDEPDSTRLRSLLRDYAHTRVAPRGRWDEAMEAQLVRSKAMRQEIWAEARQAIYPFRESELGSYLVDGINTAINTGVEREMAGYAHIPTRIIDNMFFYLMVASAILGYMLGQEKPLRRHSAFLLIVLFSFTIVLILDIDQPRSGTVIVPQGPMEELVAQMDRDAVAESRAAPPAVRSPLR